MAKSKAVRPDLTAASVMEKGLGKKSNPWVYIAAFFIPALLTLIAYAAFEIYPFGERSVLALDLNGQYIYYFERLRDAFWGNGSIFYSWGRDLSGEFMGIIGYYLASPFTIIVMLLPRTMILESIMIMQICKLGAAGVTFCVYAQKSRGVKPLQSLLFSTVYAMMGYAVIQLIDPMWIDGIVFLPLIILGVEHLIDDGRKIGYIIPLAIMFIANFYIGYMCAIFVAIYFVVYLFFGTSRKFKDSTEYLKVFGRMALATVIGLMCSAAMLLTVYNALSLGKFDFSEPDYTFTTQFNPIELIPTLLPNQYYSVNMQGLPEIYCGVISAVLLPLFYMNKKIKRNHKIGYSLVLLVLFVSMYIKPIDMLWHGGQTPNWLPYRYSFLMAFILVSMAATIFSNLDGYKLKLSHVGGVFAGIAVLVLIFDTISKSFDYDQSRYKYVAGAPYTTEESFNGETWNELWLGTLVFGLFLAAFYLAMIYLYSNAKTTKKKRIITFAMAAVVCFEAGYNAYDSFKKVNKEVAYSNRDTYYNIIQAGRDVTDSLEEYDDGLYRSEKTFFRTVNDNLAYGLKGVSHSSSVMNTRAINFLETMGYSMRSYVTRYDGNSNIADSLLGIKYVVHDPKQTGDKSILNTDYNQIFTEDYINNEDVQSTFEVYENPDALSIGYMADEDIQTLLYLGNDNPFNSQNILLSTLAGNTQFDGDNNITGFTEYYTRLPETIELDRCTDEGYSDQHCYRANAGETDTHVNIHITAETNQEIYMYLKSYNEKKVNTWISSEKDENGNFINHESLGSNAYYENHDYRAVRLGSFEPGTEIEVRLTIVDDHENPHESYVIIKDFFIYQFNYDLFKQDIEKLKANQLNVTEYNDRYIEGTVNAEEGKILFTTIPYEPGWTVEIDGEKVDNLVYELEQDNDGDGETDMVILQNNDGETGQIALINAMLGVRVPAGEHTITLKYTPPGFNIGIVLLVLGIAAIVVIFIYDRKHNKFVIARIKAKKLAKEESASVGENSAANKPVIIKSKGAPVSTSDDEKPDEKPELTDAQAAAQKNQQQKSQNKKGNNNKKNGKKKKKK